MGLHKMLPGSGILVAVAALTVCSASIDWASLNLREHHLAATLAAQVRSLLPWTYQTCTAFCAVTILLVTTTHTPWA